MHLKSYHTLASFPIVPQGKSLRTQAIRPAHRTEALVGAAGLRTFTGVLTAVAVRRETSSRQSFASATVTGPPIDAGVLAGAVAIPQQALVDV